jgi:hypothetical protein
MDIDATIFEHTPGQLSSYPSFKNGDVGDYPAIPANPTAI